MHKISSQLKERLGDDYTITEFQAMIYWLEISGREVSIDPYRGADINGKLVEEWITFKSNLKVKSRHKQSLLSLVLKVCAPEEKNTVATICKTAPVTQLAAFAKAFDCYGEVYV